MWECNQIGNSDSGFCGVVWLAPDGHGINRRPVTLSGFFMGDCCAVQAGVVALCHTHHTRVHRVLLMQWYDRIIQ